MIKDYDHLFKIVIIGDAGVGKSALLLRFSDDQFNESYLTTLGVDFRFKSLSLNERNVKLQIWDTAGQERFRTITNAYYKGAHGIVIVYDISNQTSYEDVYKYWLAEVEKYAEADIQVMMVGNKVDLEENRQVDEGMAAGMAKDKNMYFYEVSAKSAFKVDQAFNEFAKLLVKNKEVQKVDTKSRLLKNISKEKIMTQNKKCC